MTDLVERLREIASYLRAMDAATHTEIVLQTIAVADEAANHITALEAEIARKDEALRACNGATAMIEWIEWREGDKRPVAAKGEVILWHFPAQPPARYHNVGLPSYTTQDFAPARAVEGTKYARIALP